MCRELAPKKLRRSISPCAANISCRAHRRVALARRNTKPRALRSSAEPVDRALGTSISADSKLSKAALLIKNAERLVPYDTRNYNKALAIWKALQDVPADSRVQLLDRLGPSDIKSLWVTSATRFAAHSQDLQNTMGPDFSLWDLFPEEPGQVSVFEGKAAVPAFNRFRKVFFLHPEEYALYGHVDVGWGLVGRLAYPLYFKCSLEQGVFPGSHELTDMQLDYAPLSRMGLRPGAVPEGHGLPAPRDPRWPFDGRLRDHVRAVGPGVLVGRGWKQPVDSLDATHGTGFLHFLLVKAS